MQRSLPLTVLVWLGVCLGCTAGVKTQGSPGGGGSTGTGGTTGGGGGAPRVVPCNGMCTDFPADPIVDEGAPGNSSQIFGDPGGGASGGPCLLEPQVGALFPNNWLRPRFRMQAAGGQDLFEIRLHAANQGNDLVVY